MVKRRLAGNVLLELGEVATALTTVHGRVVRALTRVQDLIDRHDHDPALRGALTPEDLGRLDAVRHTALGMWDRLLGAAAAVEQVAAILDLPVTRPGVTVEPCEACELPLAAVTGIDGVERKCRLCEAEAILQSTLAARDGGR